MHSPLPLNSETMDMGTYTRLSVSNYPVPCKRNSRGRIHLWRDELFAYNPAPTLCIAIIKVG